jgi:centromere protein I
MGGPTVLSVSELTVIYLKKTWNGKDNRDRVFRLLKYISIEPFASLRSEFLSPLESAVLDESLRSRTALLGFYSTLIGQWGVKLRSQPDEK